MTIDQNLIFQKGEGDAWFRRNASTLGTFSKADPAQLLLGQLDLSRQGMISSVCDIGCANGWRLSQIREGLPNVRRLCGFDVSEAAVANGLSHSSGLDLRVGGIDEPPFAEQFDLVIVSFVLHWVDRQRLARAIASVDSLVAPNGLLLISDFYPDRPCARRYHHRRDVELYTYKQDYVGSFTALGLYRELSRLTFSHDQSGLLVGPAADQDRAVCALLHKHPDAYPVI